MLPRYEVVPLECAGPVQLGMTREAARAAMDGPPRVLRHAGAMPAVDAWHEDGFQVFYSQAGTVELVELSRGAVDAQLFGVPVFGTRVGHLVALVRKRADYDPGYPDLGATYAFPALSLALRRRHVPESPHDSEGWYFDAIGVGAAGYFGGRKRPAWRGQGY